MSKLALLAAVLIGAAFCAAGCAGGMVGAANSGNTAELARLIDSGVDINARTSGGVTPLTAATTRGRLDAVKLLLEKGADPDYSAYGLITPLHIAAGEGYPEIVRLLLDRGARTDVRSSRTNRTALETAQQRNAASPSPGRREAIDMLKRAGAAATPGNVDDKGAASAARPASAAPSAATLSSDVDAPTRKSAPRPDDYALVIGVEDYQSLPKADYGVRDAQTVRKHLEALGFPARNIISLEGPQATGNKLKSYLEEWLPLNVKPSSTLFVYYSGHGAPDPATGDAYLVPWDGDATFLKSTAYPLKKFYADLGRTKAKRIVVALDACFSGAGGRSVLAQGARPLVAKVAEVSGGDRVTVLAAASGEEITGSLNEQGHGMFTYFLLKGLSEGKKTARELHDYLLPRVQDEARRQNRQQTPALIGADAPL